MKPQKMTDDDIGSTVKTAIEDAQQWVKSNVGEDREKAARYAAGEVDLEAEKGRSQVVATKARDAVRAVMPVLMRKFFETSKPAEFVPTNPQAIESAEQATDYVQYVMQRAGAWEKTHDVFLDALIKKFGIWKVYYDESENAETDSLTGLTPEAMDFLAGAPDVQVVEMDRDTGEMKIARKQTRGKICIETVPPEDFFFNGQATSLEDATICGHSKKTTVSEVVAMELPNVTFEKVVRLSGEDLETTEGDTRVVEKADYDSPNDDSMRAITLTEAYVRMDVDGVGVAQWHRVVCAGTKHELLYREEADENPFCLFHVDPEPHAIVGRSLVDLVIADQDVATSLLRNLLDNVHTTNNPRLVVIEGDGRLNDAQQTQHGAILQAMTPSGYVPLTVPYTGDRILGAIQYYDEQIDTKTGVPNRPGVGTEALVNTSATAANLADQTLTATIDLMARNLAEGGYKQAMRKIHKLARQHPDQNTMMRIRGSYVTVDPRSWESETDVRVNVGLGNRRREMRLMGMQQALQIQQTILQGIGPGNPLVGLAEVRALVEDMLEDFGVYATDRYFRPFTREAEMQMMQQAQAQQAQQPQGDPNAAYMQAEMGKAQLRAQTDMAKLQVEAQAKAAEEERKRIEAAAKQDLARDKMIQDQILKAAEILGRHGIAVDEQRIRAMQAQNNF